MLLAASTVCLAGVLHSAMANVIGIDLGADFMKVSRSFMYTMSGFLRNYGSALRAGPSKDRSKQILANRCLLLGGLRATCKGQNEACAECGGCAMWPCRGLCAFGRLVCNTWVVALCCARVLSAGRERVLLLVLCEACAGFVVEG